MNSERRSGRYTHALAAMVVAMLILPGREVQPQDGATGDTTIVFPGATVELVFDGGYFTEGPAAAPDGSIYFSDITLTASTGMEAGHIWKYDPVTQETKIFRSPSGMSNGIIFDHEGRMVVAEQADFGGRRITRTDMATGKSMIIAGLFGGKPFNSPNDLTIDELGRVYFTDPRFVGHEPVEQPVEGVYRIDTSGTVSLIIADIRKPNGILVSPDQKTLYVAELDNGRRGSLPRGVRAKWGSRAVHAYDLTPDGNATFRETIIDVSPKLGVDGMTIDIDGNLYITAWRPYGIYVHSPDSHNIAFIPTPHAPKNVTFGRGPTNKMLFITASGCLYRIQLKKEGYHPGRNGAGGPG